MADLNVSGLVELNRFLQELPPLVERKILRGALRAGAKPLQQEIKANLPVQTGTLRDGVKISSTARGGAVSAKVKATGRHAFLAPFVEYGTAAHDIVPEHAKSLIFGSLFAEAVEHPGMAAKPVWRPALEAKQGAVVVIVGDYIKKRLTKAGLAAAGDVDIEVAE
jgi:HK97 gp10 family phage protein